ncbi:RDD family protein [Streptomyces sp. NRRL B-1140]|uniref:RDD family protein n=1 Tax=Streptomyces sp. NRRL B-1140 TaxID=1415549 RepID=UPI00099D1C43|nr:RDD family protein [Streptomyces sp. NRRL B-1140]
MTKNHDEPWGTGAEHQAPAGPRQWEQRPEHPHPVAPAAPAALQPLVECPTCGKAAGDELSCQFCGQVLFLPRGITLSTAGLRFGGYLLEGVLIICTLVIGWLVWTLIVFQYGQTPGKQLLHMRVVHIPQARTAGWWRMAFREIVAKTIVGFLAAVTFAIPYFWLLWDRNRQELWDKMATTLVVSDREDRLRLTSSDGRVGTPQP